MAANTGKSEYRANKVQQGEEKKYLISSNVINVQVGLVFIHKFDELLHCPVFELTELTKSCEQCYLTLLKC